MSISRSSFVVLSSLVVAAVACSKPSTDGAPSAKSTNATTATAASSAPTESSAPRATGSGTFGDPASAKKVTFANARVVAAEGGRFEVQISDGTMGCGNGPEIGRGLVLALPVPPGDFVAPLTFLTDADGYEPNDSALRDGVARVTLTAFSNKVGGRVAGTFEVTREEFRPSDAKGTFDTTVCPYSKNPEAEQDPPKVESIPTFDKAALDRANVEGTVAGKPFVAKSALVTRDAIEVKVTFYDGVTSCAKRDADEATMSHVTVKTFVPRGGTAPAGMFAVARVPGGGGWMRFDGAELTEKKPVGGAMVVATSAPDGPDSTRLGGKFTATFCP